jgi:hypothetical protein
MTMAKNTAILKVIGKADAADLTSSADALSPPALVKPFAARLAKPASPESLPKP